MGILEVVLLQTSSLHIDRCFSHRKANSVRRDKHDQDGRLNEATLEKKRRGLVAFLEDDHRSSFPVLGGCFHARR